MVREMKRKNSPSTFFSATLLLWLISVLYAVIRSHRTDLLSVVAGGLFYQSANVFFRFRFSSSITGGDDGPLFVNTSVSLLHSSVTSASVIFVLVNQWKTDGSHMMFEHSQLFGGTWPWAYQALCFSCGYFAYDQLDMLRYRLYSGWIPSILVHHFILLICFTLALYRNVTINYLILTLICELHSIFLHVRKLRRMVGVRDTKIKLVKVEWALNWVTFIFARVASHILITVKLIKDANKFGNGVELPLALFGMSGMNLLNLFLGIDLFRAFKKEMKPQLTNHNPKHQ